MRNIVILILALVGTMIANTSAFAHCPYYSTVAKIRLPDGGLGEVRLINGDGIMFTDPVRPLIVNSSDQLLARGPKAHSIGISCTDDDRCLIVDLWNERVYDLEPSSFRQGPVQPAVRDDASTDNWDLEDGDESWGFTMRDASARELLTANLALARQSVFGLATIAALVGLGAFALVPFRLDHRSRWARLLARAILSILGSMVFLFLLAVTFWSAMLAGLSFEIWLVPTLLGAGSVWLVFGISKWRAHRQARV